MAVCFGDIDLVQILLNHRQIDVNSKDHNEWTPLHYACFKGLADIVFLLCDNGADFYSRSKDSEYPLHLAAAHNHAALFSDLEYNRHFTAACMRGAGKEKFVQLKVRELNV